MYYIISNRFFAKTNNANYRTKVQKCSIFSKRKGTPGDGVPFCDTHYGCMLLSITVLPFRTQGRCGLQFQPRKLVDQRRELRTPWLGE